MRSVLQHVCSAVIRPAITYRSTVWHAPSDTKEARKDTTAKLAAIQNRCLKVLAWGYKATPFEVLHTEIIMAPIQEYLNVIQAKRNLE